MTTRADIVACARSFLGTPFHHAERQPGIGLDCAGVLVCCAREQGLVEPGFDVPAYEARPDGRTLLAWCRRYMGPEVGQEAMQPGDALVMITDTLPQHLGVVGDYRYGGLSLIHAANTARPPRVIETRLMFSRVQRFVAAFTFPNIA